MNICIYCGSSTGFRNEFVELAEEFGEMMAKADHRLIYGGSSLGIMGALANSVMKHNGEVFGVIPEKLFKKEVAHRGITKLITVDDMHQRKSVMADLADAFIAFPGGFGTLEELFEIITWNQIGIFKKPVTIFNPNGFYNSLIEMIEHASHSGFIKPENMSIFNVAETLEDCIQLSIIRDQ